MIQYRFGRKRKRETIIFMNIYWKKIELEDRAVFEPYYEYEQSKCCEFSFANNYLWSPFYSSDYAIIQDMLVFRSSRNEISVGVPLAKSLESEKNLKEVLLFLEEYFKEEARKFRMHSVTEEKFNLMEEIFPGKYQVEYYRDDADYIYETKKLMTLAGKKLHGKRNHINKFKQNYPGWSYESLNKENMEECLEMAEEWKRRNLCGEKDAKHAEFCVTRRAIKNFEQLNLKGGIIRADGKIVAFTLGEELNKDMLVIHIEKAYADIQGAYPMINQQFLLHEAEGYQYVNREEDAGAEGLRKAKMSYYPVFLQEKGILTIKGEKE